MDVASMRNDNDNTKNEYSDNEVELLLGVRHGSVSAEVETACTA
jgi:hypothetical protein